tara:strand:- start:1001 stop:1288 length:288 start_codon:yes stop_codon:yes gene_type:complete
MSKFEITSNVDTYEKSKTLKITLPILTKYEKARIIGVRMQQISDGAVPMIDTTGMSDIKEIVEMELEQRMTPLMVRRYLFSNVYEDWKIEDFLKI